MTIPIGLQPLLSFASLFSSCCSAWITNRIYKIDIDYSRKKRIDIVWRICKWSENACGVHFTTLMDATSILLSWKKWKQAQHLRWSDDWLLQYLVVCRIIGPLLRNRKIGEVKEKLSGMWERLNTKENIRHTRRDTERKKDILKSS